MEKSDLKGKKKGPSDVDQRFQEMISILKSIDEQLKKNSG
jgi:hypothetical protein